MPEREYNVVSFGGIELNTTAYRAFFTKRYSPRNLMASSLSIVPRPHTFPSIPYFERSEGRMRIQVQPYDCTDVATAMEELAEIFDIYNVTEPPKRLIIEDEAGTHWYKMAKAIGFEKAEVKTEASFSVSLVSEDPEWIQETLQEDSWAIAATPLYRVLALDGNRPSLPTFEITPTNIKAGDFAHRRFVLLYNRVQRRLNHYPVELTGAVSAATGWDTQAEVGAGRMQADGDDLRVYVNGREVDRWFSNINQTNTHLWIVVDMPPMARTYLNANINAGDTRLRITDRRTVGSFPERDGYILLQDAVAGDEIVGYRKFNGRAFKRCRRGLCDTADVGHLAANVTIYFLPLIVWVYYGNPAMTAPWQDDDYMPAFALDTSWNGTWDWDAFGDDNGKQAARWQRTQGGKLRELRSITPYTGNQGTMASPWVEMGLQTTKDNPAPPGEYHSRWVFDSDVGIATVDYNGEHREDHADDLFYLKCKDWLENQGWATVNSNSLSGSVGAWAAWAAGGPHNTRTGALKLKLIVPDRSFREGDNTGNCYVEVGDFILTHRANKYPYVEMDARHDNPYHMESSLFNISTDQGLDIDAQFRIINRTLTIDCEDKECREGVAGLESGNWLQAMERARQDIRFPWIELVPKRSNLVEGWNFEYWPDGDVDRQPYPWADWEALGGGAATNDRELDKEFVYEHDSALRVTATNLIGAGTWKGVQETLTVAEGRLVAGTWYTLEGWVRNPIAITNGQLVIRATGALTGPQDAIPAGTAGPHAAWTFYTLDFQMNAGDAQLVVYVGIEQIAANASGVAWFDNIVLRPRDTVINCLKNEETGVAGVTIDTTWHNRLMS